MTIKRVCIIVNYNLYESKRYFTKKLAEAFHRKNIETKILDAKGRPIHLEEIVAFQPEFTCSFNSYNLGPSNLFMADITHIPHLSILVDPAIYSVQVTKSPYSIISCVDRFDCESIRSSNFEHVFFWPHAVEPELDGTHEEKIYDVVFLGSCHDYENLRLSWRQKYSPIVTRILDDAIDQVLSDRNIPLSLALVSAWDQTGYSTQNVDFLTLFRDLDNYTRGKDRVELIRSIKNAPVHVFGGLMIEEPLYQRGWEHYLAGQKNVTIHPAVTFEESLNVMKQSKVCLNSMPFFKDGSHERVFAGFACGALPVSSYSKYLAEEFVGGEEMLFYQPGRWDEVEAKLLPFLQDETKRKQAVQKGRNKVLSRHTWDQRVQQLIDVMPSFINEILSNS